jgi:hypothetical protein
MLAPAGIDLQHPEDAVGRLAHQHPALRTQAKTGVERSRVRGIVRSPVGNDMHSDPFYDVLRGDPRFERISRGE